MILYSLFLSSDLAPTILLYHTLFLPVNNNFEILHKFCILYKKLLCTFHKLSIEINNKICYIIIAKRKGDESDENLSLTFCKQFVDNIAVRI